MRKMTVALFVFGLLWGATSARADDPKAILDKAIKATGGEEKLSKFPAFHAKTKGKVNVFDMSIEFIGENYGQAPDKMRVTVDAEVMGTKFQRIQVINGKTGWIQQMGNTEDMTEDQMNENKEQLYWLGLSRLVSLKKPEYTLTAVPDIKVDDKPVVGFKVSHKDHKDVTLYFDKDSGRLVRIVRKGRNMDGSEVDEEATFSNFKDFGGIQIPTKQIVKREGKDFVEAEITEYKPLEKADDSNFGKP